MDKGLKIAKKILLIVLSLTLMSCISAPAPVNDFDREWDKILFSAESLFKSMKERNYSAIWGSLTAESKNNIVNNVYKASIKSGVEYSKEQIRTDFEIGGLISKTYWNSYLYEFDPDMVLEQSKWDIGFVKNERAEIKIQYKKAQQPALLKMYKEDNAWKVGLEETFEGRRYLIYK
jgi:hypothetical protein